MNVSLNQISGSYLQPADLHGAAEIKNVSVGMRNRNIAGKHLKADRLYRAKVANGSVGHDPSASESHQNVGVNFAYERSQAGMMVHILDDDDARFGNGLNMPPPLRPGVITVSLHRRIRAADSRGGGIAHQSREFRKNAADAGI